MGSSRLYPWIVVLLLLACIVLSFVDRQVLSLLVTPMKAELGLSDFQVGLLGGPAFVFLFALAGVPLGWLADRVSRPLLIACGLVFWSMATMACGASAGFWQLWAARAAVGLGEGTLGPSAHSLIGDSFDARRLPLAMGVYSLGSSWGAGLALIVGGQALAWAAHSAWLADHALSPWRMTFVLVGVPGLLLAPLVLSAIREPRQAAPLRNEGGSAFRFMARRWTFFLPFTLGSALMTGGVVAQLVWLPVTFERTYGSSVAEFSTIFGILKIVVGSAGTAVFAILAAATAARRKEGQWIGIMVATALANAVCCLALAAAPSALWANVTVGASLLVGAGFTLANPALQLIAPSGLRGRLAAIYTALASLLGWSLGSSAVGAVTDYVLHDPSRLVLSLSWVLTALWASGALCLLLSWRAFEVILEGRSDPFAQTPFAAGAEHA